MATSSIFANVKIDSPEKAKQLADALEKASGMGRRVPTSEVKPPVRDMEAIRKMYERRLKNK